MLQIPVTVRRKLHRKVSRSFPVTSEPWTGLSVQTKRKGEGVRWREWYRWLLMGRYQAAAEVNYADGERKRKKRSLFAVGLMGGIDLPSPWLTFSFSCSSAVYRVSPIFNPKASFFLFPLPSFSPTLPQINPLPLPSSFSLLWSLCFLCMQTLLFSCNNIKNPPASSIPGSLNPTSTWEQLNTLSPALIFLFMMGGSKELVSCSHQTIRGFIKINRFINKLVGLTACFQPLSKYFSSALLPEPWCSMCGSSGVDVLADCLDHLLLTKPSSVHLFYHNHCKDFPLCC